MNRFDSDLLSRISLYLIEPEHSHPELHRYAFPVEPGDTLTANITALSDTGKVLAQRALIAWSEATGIHFRFVGGDDAHLVFVEDRAGANTHASGKDGVLTSSSVNVSTVYHRNGTTLDSVDSEAFSIYLHEIGHALGFDHPAPYESPYVYGEDNVFTNDSKQTNCNVIFPTKSKHRY